jgi:hypothetical protein
MNQKARTWKTRRSECRNLFLGVSLVLWKRRKIIREWMAGLKSERMIWRKGSRSPLWYAQAQEIARRFVEAGYATAILSRHRSTLAPIESELADTRGFAFACHVGERSELRGHRQRSPNSTALTDRIQNLR